MKPFFAHLGPFPHLGGGLSLVILLLLIMFVALVVADASKNKK
jgi:hypothetical protein